MSFKVITGMVRMSYVHVFEPRVQEGEDEGKYGVSLIIPKSDTKTIKKIEDAIKKAAEEGKAKFGGKVPRNLKTPLRDGDEERPDDPAYEDAMFINANGKQKPKIVDKDLDPIMEQEEFYSGCYGRASVSFYAYSVNGNKGVAAGLNNLQKLKDGEPLSGGSTPEEDFADDFEYDMDDLM